MTRWGSDSSQGVGWWQASDGKWYEPAAEAKASQSATEKWIARTIGDRSGVRRLSLRVESEGWNPAYDLVEPDGESVLARITRRSVDMANGERMRVRRRFGRMRVVGRDSVGLVEAIASRRAHRDHYWVRIQAEGECADLVLTNDSVGPPVWRRAELRSATVGLVAVEIAYLTEVGAWSETGRWSGNPVDGATRDHWGRLHGSVAHAQEVPTELVTLCVLLALGWRWRLVAPRHGHWTETHVRARAQPG